MKSTSETAVREQEVRLRLANGDVTTADLSTPEDAHGLVVFAHGSGSSRLSPRNRAVAGALNSHGFATLLLDLLTAGEERIDEVTREYRFDINLLATRLVTAVDWTAEEEQLRNLRVGLFGASTGAAAALVAAASRSSAVSAVVSRGGRPDLAGAALELVRAPTLLIVGGRDMQVIQLNREALDRLQSVKRLEIVEGATHLFDEPGTLERVTDLTAQWFTEHLVESGAAAHVSTPATRL